MFTACRGYGQAHDKCRAKVAAGRFCGNKDMRKESQIFRLSLLHGVVDAGNPKDGRIWIMQKDEGTSGTRGRRPVSV